MKARVLFFAEAVTLAHVTRPWILASGLDPHRFEIHFASNGSYEFLFDSASFVHHSIQSISSSSFTERLEKGVPLYRYRELTRYLEEDLAVIDRVRPDLIVGDFRLSLAVSAPLRDIPYAALTNAHWSPYNVRRYAPLPEHALTGAVGVSVASYLFRWMQGPVFAIHAHAVNRLRREHGLVPVGSLRSAYTHGDHTLYLDLPSLVPTVDAPPNHRYLGPVVWSAQQTMPEWWCQIPADRPCIYVSMGSSGAVDQLQTVVRALAGLPVSVLVATAGRGDVDSLPDNVWVDTFLPGSAVARKSALVVCNGGSATAYQALAEGVPILGIPTNMDQYFTMEAIARAGAGRLVRAGKVTGESVRETANDLLEQPSYRVVAERLAAEVQRYDAVRRFAEFADELLIASPVKS